MKLNEQQMKEVFQKVLDRVGLSTNTIQVLEADIRIVASQLDKQMKVYPFIQIIWDRFYGILSIHGKQKPGSSLIVIRISSDDSINNVADLIWRKVDAMTELLS